MNFKKYKNGDVFGSLTITNQDAGRTKSGDRLAECLCACGRKTITRVSYLGNGHTQTCGCRNGTKILKHGMYKSKAYSAWSTAIQMCENPNHQSYKDHGGIGIKFDETWRSSFDKFISDVGHPPSGELIFLCRKDAKKDYNIDNTYWGSGLSRILGRKKSAGTTSIYKGVCWISEKRKWRAEIKHGQKRHHLGYFDNQDDAFKAYCEAHLRLRGESVINGRR